MRYLSAPNKHIELPITDESKVLPIKIILIELTGNEDPENGVYKHAINVIKDIWMDRNTEQSEAAVNSYIYQAAFNWYLSNSSKIYMATFGQNEVAVGYAMADGIKIHDLYVRPNHRRSRVGLTLLNAVIDQNEYSQEFHFLAAGEDHIKNGYEFLRKVGAEHKSMLYKDAVMDRSMVLINRKYARSMEYQELRQQMESQGIFPLFHENLIQLQGRYTAEQLRDLARMTDLYNGEE